MQKRIFSFNFFKGGGEKRIASQKLEWKGQSKVGSIDNIKHRPGGGNIKVNIYTINTKQSVQESFQ